MSIAQFFKLVARISWGKPTKSDVIIFDQFSERHLSPFFKDQNYLVFDTKFLQLNIWVLIFSLKFGRPSSKSYLSSFIWLSKARLVISTIDNSPLLYQIKRNAPQVYVVVIQNGRRDTIAKNPGKSFVQELATLNQVSQSVIDYYFTFGSTEARQFQKLIECTFISHGSLKNNLFDIMPEPKNRILTFITSLTQDCIQIESNPSALLGYSNDTPISLVKYFEADFIVAKWLQDFALRNGLVFQILGKRGKDHPEQELLFRHRVPGEWKFVFCDSEYDSYRTLFESQFIAGVDSTLLYEMFGRGKRSAFFTIRKSTIGIDSIFCPNFGYPEISSESGPMWTNCWSEKEFERIMNTILTTSDHQWSEIVANFRPFVMNWDFGNTMLAETLSNLGFTIESDPRVRSRSALNTVK